MRIVGGLGPEVDQLLAGGDFFWLDLRDPDDATLTRFGEQFGIHPLALEDTREMRQRPKLDEYRDKALLVFYGLNGRGGLCEVHLHLSGHWMVTVHRPPCPAMDDAARTLTANAPRSPEEAIYRVLDALTDAYFPVLDGMEDEVDGLMDAMFERPGSEQRRRLFLLRRKLATLHRVVVPQRDVLAHAGERLGALEGLDAQHAAAWLRDVFDHLQSLAQRFDGLTDVLAGALEIHLSSVSNRLNEVMKQLTVISVVFLPLTFVTGFFGQNFGWLTAHIDTWWQFVAYGGGSLVLAVGAMFWWFRRSGFLDA